jgi:uncharacterized protein YndB with AHSA1/START domain
MEQELTLKRTFDAPIELVFKAWTDPSLIAQWWGPTYFTIPVCKVDPRPGGKLYIVMHGPKNSDFDIDLPMTGTFKEFVPPNRLVWTSEAIFDEKGVPQLETLSTLNFTEKDGKTEMILQIVLLKTNPAMQAAWAGAETGWNQSLDKLAALEIKV